MHIDWIPTIGDPTPIGWLIVITYFVTAFLCYRAYRRASPSRRHVNRTIRQRQFWLFLTAAFIFLGINKQLDLQSLMTEFAREQAKALGWYEFRRVFQGLFLAAMAGLGLLVMLLSLWRLRRSGMAVRVALTGFGFTMIFVVLRAASFHRVDIWIGTEIMGMRWNWILELSGVLTVASGTVIDRRSGRR